MSPRIRLGESLVHAGLINQAQLDEALSRRLTTGERIGESLVALGYISERDLLRTLAKEADIPFLEPRDLTVDPAVATLLPVATARAQSVIPLRQEGRALVVAMANPFDVSAIRAIERATARQVRAVAADAIAIVNVINSVYDGGEHGADGNGQRSASRDMASERMGWPTPRSASATAEPRAHSPQADEGATAAELVDSIIRGGVTIGATDIHIEPLEDQLQIRYRVDGVLQLGPTFAKTLQAALMSRIKILAGLDIAESRMAQDGRVRLRAEGRPIDLRVSTFPTVHGEDTVLRILDRGRITLRLDSLGIEPDDLELLREALKKPFGMIPVTGPTGSGKTTTLYSALLEMNTGDRCIITLEDPVEYEVERIRQSQINVRAGLTFATGLRSILRHDPDVILVGEMRDQETVQIALSAALTGHLVLTTLHTTTAAGTIPRLLDMGAEPFIVASAVNLLVSQRLVRVLCPDCKVPMEVPPAVRRQYGLEQITIFGPRGCGTCRRTGFRGRIGIFEFLPMTDSLIEGIYERRSPEDLRRESKRPDLLQAGLRKVRAGVTSLDEVLRVTV